MTWVEMDMTALAFEPGTFDVVIDKAAIDALATEEGSVWSPDQKVGHFCEPYNPTTLRLVYAFTPWPCWILTFKPNSSLPRGPELERQSRLASLCLAPFEPAPCHPIATPLLASRGLALPNSDPDSSLPPIPTLNLTLTLLSTRWSNLSGGDSRPQDAGGCITGPATGWHIPVPLLRPASLPSEVL